MEKAFVLRFATTRDILMNVETELKAFLAKQKIAELDALGVLLAFHEHCLNIIDHGIACASGKISEITASLDVSADAGCFNAVLEIEDATPLFDPMAVAAGDGLGISLIRAISGSIKWENRNGKNICTFVFPKLKRECGEG